MELFKNRKPPCAAKGDLRGLKWIGLLLLLSFSQIAKAQLSGTYTICPSSAGTCNYTTIAAAANDLNSKGVSGPTIFNIYGGNYNESVSIGNVSGANTTNTITFNGNGSSAASTGTKGTGVTRIYNSSNVWSLSNTKYLTLQNMVIDQTSSSYSVYNYYTQYVSISNCLIRFPIGTCCSYSIYDYYSYKTVWTNNMLRGGYMTVYGNNAGNSTAYGYATWKNNRFTQAYYYNMYLNNYNMSVFDGNYIDSAYGTGYSCFDLYGSGNTWKNNKVGNANMQYGLILEYPNYNSTSNPYNVVNNMIWGQGSYGLYLYIYYASNCNVHAQHNTCAMTSGTYPLYCYGYASSGWEITNNNFSNGSNSAAVLYADNSCKVDGNNFYTGGGTLIYYGNGTAYSDIASYKVAAAKFGHGTFDQSVAPNYKSTTDVHLDKTKSAPYCKSVGVLVDIDGDTRCAAFPTSGADENFFGKGAFKTKISGSSTVYAGTPTTFFSNSKLGEPKIHAWYLDKIGTLTKLSDSVTLVTTALTVGTHKLYLVSQSCAGSSTDSILIIVVNPSKAPVSDFISNKNLIKQGDYVKFTDLSNNGPSKWNWVITPSTAIVAGSSVPAFTYIYGTSSGSFAPIVRFNAGGQYKVCLTSSNAAGTGNTNCKVNYIEVISTVNIGSLSTNNYTKGFLYDDGGPNGNYSYTGSNYRKAVIDPCADSVYMVINYFNTWCGYDFLRIYDGKDNKGKALHLPCTSTIGYNQGFTGGAVSTFCYGSLPGCQPNTVNAYAKGGTIDTLLAASGKMYVEFEANYANNAPGFEAYWWSIPRKGTKPTAKFSSVSSICVNGVVNFTNQSTGPDLQYLWSLSGTPGYFDATSKDVSWPYFYTGTQTVTLVVYNCGGSDTLTKTISVVNPPVPVSSFTADNTNPTSTDVVYLSTASIKACVDSYSWKITKRKPYKTGIAPSVIYVTGSSSSANPAITLPETGYWDASLTVANATGTNTYKKDSFFNVKDPYCIPDVSVLVPDIGISKVSLNTISNSSSAGVVAYQNFISTVSTTLEIGGKYKLSVERPSNKNMVNRSVFIDWNGDGDFNDAMENYALDSNSGALVWNTEISIPSFATKGATVMRIAINQASYGNKPCGVNEYGEYEDYRLYLTTDHTKPWITLRGAKDTLAATDTVYIEQGHEYFDKGADAYDAISGTLTKLLTSKYIGSPYNKFIPGTYKLAYNVKDAAGNAADTKTRVIIETGDKTPPILKVAAPETTYVEIHTLFKAPLVIEAIDSVDGDVSGLVKTVSTVDTTKIGRYEITYSVEDGAQNGVIVKRYVYIIDTIAPVISLKGKDTVLLEVGGSYTEQGLNIWDNYNSTSYLAKNLTVVNMVDANKLGIYKISYITTDESGNKSKTITRIVKVIDTIAPVVSVLGDIKTDWDVLVKFADLGAIPTDNYDKNLSITKSGTFYDAFPDGMPNKLGSYTIIYTAVDGSGNIGTAVRIVNVLDRIAPVIKLKGEPSATICRWKLYTDAGYTLSDNFCKQGEMIVSKEGTFSTFNTLLNGLYTFRYKAVDLSGNVGYSEYRYVLVEAAESVSCISGIANNKDIAKQLSIFPNPSTGKFSIKLDMAVTEKVKVSISNIYGQEVAIENNATLNNNQMELDLSSQPAGMYTVNIMIGNNLITKRLIMSK